MLPSLTLSEREDIFRWLKPIWFDCTRETVRDLPWFIRLSLGSRMSAWLETEWAERRDMLEALGLFTPEERPRFQ